MELNASVVGAALCVAIIAAHSAAPTAHSAAPTAHSAAPTAHSAAPTGPGERLLKGFLAEVTTLRADFTQTLVDADGRLLQEAGGTLALRRPGRFRWDYRRPNEQTIVADGARLWLYDAELAQVTVRGLDETLASTPAMLLSGDGDINAHSSIDELGEHDGMTWVEVVPKARDTDYESVRIAFEGRELAVMELVDGLDQVTRIEFSNLVRNPQIDLDVFEFTPPPGTDVIGPDG